MVDHVKFRVSAVKILVGLKCATYAQKRLATQIRFIIIYFWGELPVIAPLDLVFETFMNAIFKLFQSYLTE